TDWFQNPAVRVNEGIVFLTGQTDSDQRKEWAGKLAGNTENVVAVVNQIEIDPLPFWDMTPAWQELRGLGSYAIQRLPHILAGLLFLALAWAMSGLASKGTENLFRRRFRSRFLSDVARRTVAVLVFLFGVFLALRVSGLTGVAMTVLGGTGLIGLAIGFAFRDIAENFLASILISMQRPFSAGDRIQVAGYEGFVQSVNTRATLLMTIEGNHVQIPNATIYKDTITNLTANPNSRFDFAVGIGYDDNISKAQSIIQEVLREHPAVVDDSELLVLVDSLGAATINLRVYFWVNISEHSGLKVRSSVIRMTKTALDNAGISMPDEAREVVFPGGVPVKMIEKELPKADDKQEVEEESTSHSAEGDLSSEATEIEQQAKRARSPEPGENLLDTGSA
ncbi:MAG: mechanosensitive ion channel family protein, partial [Verrucomicrobiales bacterium]|nr:mechanosensitive ion channel family protein [Verrucomicrobiales bacterium]